MEAAGENTTSTFEALPGANTLGTPRTAKAAAPTPLVVHEKFVRANAPSLRKTKVLVYFCPAAKVLLPKSVPFSAEGFAPFVIN